jgi:hypothetical protein
MYMCIILFSGGRLFAGLSICLRQPYGYNAGHERMDKVVGEGGGQEP